MAAYIEEIWSVLLTSLAGGRIYPQRAPRNPETPYIVFERISGGHDHTLAGSAGFARPRFQLTYVADTYPAARQLAEEARLILQPHGRDTVTVDAGPPERTILIGGFRVLDDYDLSPASPAMPEAAEAFAVAHDVIVIHEEPKS